ncbi:MAG: ATP-binding protein [Eubacteriales bacterium]
MYYLKRDLENKFLEMNGFFKAILVTGARQVGKTTMLKKLSENQDRTYVTLDDLMVRDLAQNDPALFFQTYKPPIIIDEVQYAPALFHQIKIICDNTEERGLFWLTGSQQYNLMEQVLESLAGRIGILSLYSLSKSEKGQLPYYPNINFTLHSFLEREKIVPKTDIHDVFEYIWRGGMPDVQTASENMRTEYYNSYVDTYLMRDVTQLGGVTDSLRFRKFLVACASLVSEQINYKTLADTAEISQPTAKNWIKLLEGLGILYLLPPYANNHLKRLTKTSKLYFCDTGLCAYLSMWPSKDTLMNGAASGHFFENFIIIELLKRISYGNVKVNMYYYRDSNGKEIDLLLESSDKIHPLEIKKSANPNKREIKKFDVINKTNMEKANGGIVCMCEKLIPIDEHNYFIPCSLL